jgi:hypothetical protein
MIPYSLCGTVDLVHTSEGVRCKLEIPGHWFVGSTKPEIFQRVDPSAAPSPAAEAYAARLTGSYSDPPFRHP